MQTIKLTLEYDGTQYAGWQRQADQPTIQATLELVIGQVAQAVDGNDARTVQPGQQVGFVQEASDSGGVLAERFAQDLHRHLRVAAPSQRPIHLAHAALAQLLLQHDVAVAGCVWL